MNLLKNLKWPGGYQSAAPFNRQIEVASPASVGTIQSFSNNFRSERRKRTANGRQDGGDEKVIGDSDISVPGGGGGCVYDGVLRE